jgi:hypothetical protein
MRIRGFILERTTEQWENLVRFKDDKIGELDKSLEYVRSLGRALPDYQEEDIRKIRILSPNKTAKYVDSEIARAYSGYCEENHGAGWTDTDLDAFIAWAFNGAMNNYI